MRSSISKPVYLNVAVKNWTEDSFVYLRQTKNWSEVTNFFNKSFIIFVISLNKNNALLVRVAFLVD